jgi:hypothetical protein
MNESSKKFVIYRDSLRKISNNVVIEVGPFVSALKYVLEEKLSKYCTICVANYGEIDFIVNAIKFKLHWMAHGNMKLFCKHLEGMDFIDTEYILNNDSDCASDLINIIEFCVKYVTPFDV